MKTILGVRKRCKDDIEEEDDDDFEDFEDSADEYEPSESSESENEYEEKNCSSSDDESNIVTKRVLPSVQKTLQRRSTRNSTRHQDDLIFESDKYFGHTNRKVKLLFFNIQTF